MKYIRPDGRVLADIGKERKQKLYERLLKEQKTLKEWLQATIDEYLKEGE